MHPSLVARLLVLLLVCSGGTLAQNAAIFIDAPPLPPPVRMDIGKSGQPIRLQSLALRSEIVGGHARTRAEMEFFNPNDRVLEGELVFPLLAGQEIDGFALDIGGELREAVPVEKARGKEIFEEVIRRRVDPALLETTSGENFRLRVYPLPARGTRRVVIHYSERLDVRHGHYLYRAAIAAAAKLERFSLEVLVASPAGAPLSRIPGNADFTLQASGTWYRGEIRRAAFDARDWIEIAIPDGGTKSAAMASVQHWRGDDYLQIDAPIDLRRAPRRLPARVGIVWDSSLSGRLRDHAAEFELLDEYFRAMRRGSVELIRLRDVAESPQTFVIVGGDWSALKRALQETVYDGASDLQSWQFGKGIAEVLFFSEGLGNYGASIGNAPVPHEGVSIFPVVASASANRAALRALSRQGGDADADLLIDLGGDRQAATDALLQARTRVASVTAAGDGELRVDAAMLARGRLAVSGRFKGQAPPRIRLELIDPDGRRRLLDVPVAPAATQGDPQQDAPLVARRWARLTLDRMEGDYRRHRAEIRRLGLNFGMLTRETSLIVLDDVADYVRHDIAPPPSLRARYDELKAGQATRERTTRAAHLDRIAAQYADKVAWWKRDFPKTREVHVLAKQDRAEPDASMAREMAPSPPPVPTSTPAPIAEAAPMERAAGAPAGAQARAPRKSAARSGGRDDAAADSAPSIGIGLKKWTADAAYMDRLRTSTDAGIYADYVDERADWINSSAYYLDVAELLFERRQPVLALRVLSNLAEMELENRAILRILGYRLMQAGKPALAVPLFEQVRELAPFEPQSHRDLGLAYADVGALQQAADALYEVARREWDGRFAEVGLIALTEMNALIATHPGQIDTARFDARLLHKLPVDLRVVLNWDADNSDMDLWVTDPNGERAYYGNRLTRQGGRMSVDLTAGYGPEEFMLKSALPGTYKVEANYYGNRQQLISGTVNLRLVLITGFGTSHERRQSTILRLGNRQEVVLVGEFEVGAGEGAVRTEGRP
jgi:hypothetical protein